MEKTKTIKIGTLITVAILLGACWSILGRKEYFYNHNFGTVGGVSLFPLFLFPLGLISAYIIGYFIFEYILKIKNFLARFFCFSVMYVVFLLMAETFAYYVLNIHNLGTAQYPGLPICQCLHAPHWMQAVYLGMGPLYFLIVSLINQKITNRS